jgi:hypothetical protein
VVVEVELRRSSWSQPSFVERTAISGSQEGRFMSPLLLLLRAMQRDAIHRMVKETSKRPLLVLL